MIDLCGMQVEASYRKDDYERRAAEAHLVRSIRSQPLARRSKGIVQSIRRRVPVGVRISVQVWVRDDQPARREGGIAS